MWIHIIGSAREAMLQAYPSGLALAEPRGVNPALARWHLTIKENPASCPLG